MKLWQHFLNAMTAVAFAEAGEFTTAREMLHQQTSKTSNQKQPPLADAYSIG
ncbi:hypothetical protein ACFL5J_00350 [Thermodesulfobacteriota bacterium]